MSRTAGVYCDQGYRSLRSFNPWLVWEQMYYPLPPKAAGGNTSAPKFKLRHYPLSTLLPPLRGGALNSYGFAGARFTSALEPASTRMGWPFSSYLSRNFAL
jgi:hypothetical protein